MRYAYQNRGNNLVAWSRSAPAQTRAADAKSLGSLSGDTLGALEIPLPGAPEPLGRVMQSDGGFRRPAMGCSSCTGGMGAVSPLGSLPTAAKYAAGAVGLFLLYKHFKKR